MFAFLWFISCSIMFSNYICLLSNEKFSYYPLHLLVGLEFFLTIATVHGTVVNMKVQAFLWCPDFRAFR